MTSTGAYRVLARKYRPQTFADLIGQEAMVRTLRNAFASGRIAQAYMLTGVRGVGKTTTARILARALNYSGPPGITGPTLDMPEPGEHCQAIIESRHIDVTEMDAASNTGIGDMRVIIESVRYSPAQARYKVYIIDEVHMLSTQAFNGILKTLEEPPEHVKFIFATTEIRKVPITVLSRCQRFDLKRVDAAELAQHLQGICEKEAVEAEAEALGLIARVGDGSVRDSLSLLDQAIAHGSGRVETEAVQAMLGLADRARIMDLFENVMRGKPAEALAELRAQYDLGADPTTVLTELADTTHFVTRLKVAPATLRDPGLSELERTRGRQFADGLSLRSLNRTWQILLKGIPEAQTSPRPLAAAEMVLIRLCYAADLPTPDEALRRLSGAKAETPAAPPSPLPPSFASVETARRAPAAPAAPARMAASSSAVAYARPSEAAHPSDPELAALIAPDPPAAAKAPVASVVRLSGFSDIVKLAAHKRDLVFKNALETQMRPIRFAPHQIAVSLVEGAPPSLGRDLARRLEDWTGARWDVEVEQAGGGPTLRETQRSEDARMKEEIRGHPIVAAALQTFPGATIMSVRVAEPEAEPENEAPPFEPDAYAEPEPEPLEED